MKSFFNAVTRNTKMVGDGTVGQLIDWLERYINVLFPENGIEYWADNHHAGPNRLRRGDRMPPVSSGLDAGSMHHVACYVREGSNEGRIIEVLLYLRGDVYKSLVWIKSFGSADECWMMARAIDRALDSLIFYYELPEIVAMADKMPRQERWHRETSLKEEVTILTTPDRLLVSTPSGLVLDDRSWADQGPKLAKLAIDARVKDWSTVLTNMQATFKHVDVSADQVVAPDLPGYVISKRGVDVEGFYVLPPGGDELDDRTYLGYFPDADAAITASREHQARQTQVAA